MFSNSALRVDSYIKLKIK